MLQVWQDVARRRFKKESIVYNRKNSAERGEKKERRGRKTGGLCFLFYPGGLRNPATGAGLGERPGGAVRRWLGAGVSRGRRFLPSGACALQNGRAEQCAGGRGQGSAVGADFFSSGHALCRTAGFILSGERLRDLCGRRPQPGSGRRSGSARC